MSSPQVAFTIALAMAVLWFRERYSLWLQMAAAAVVLWSTWSIGGLLDGRRRAREHELVRVLSAFGLMLGLGAATGYFRASWLLGALWSLASAWALTKPDPLGGAQGPAAGRAASGVHR